MSTPLDPIIRTVFNMMRQFGGTSTFTVSIEGPYDYETSTAPVIHVDYTVQTLCFDYLQKKDGIGTETSALIQNGDKQMFIRPKEGVPFPIPRSDTVTYKGEKFNIVTAKDINPSGNLSVLWEIYLRK